MIARLALTEAGINHEQVFVDILFRGSQQLPTYVRLNPHMTVPTLVLPERVLNQSRDILNVAMAGMAQEFNAEISLWIDLHYSYQLKN